MMDNVAILTEMKLSEQDIEAFREGLKRAQLPLSEFVEQVQRSLVDMAKAVEHLSPLIADNAGFPVGDMAQAYEDFAKHISKTSGADLTDEERALAFRMRMDKWRVIQEARGERQQAQLEAKDEAQHTCTIRQVADVVQLDAHRLAPDPYVVEAVRALLDLAESGELQALQWAGALSKGRTRVATVGQWSDVIQMLGASTMLKMHVEAMALEVMEEI